MIIERSFKTKPVHQGYIEPHACVVSVAKDGHATIWSSSQGHFMVRDMTAQLTGMKLSDVRAIPAEIGGGFGGKTIVYLEPVALVLSRKSGRPVKMVMTPPGGVPRHGPDIGLVEHGQDRRHQGRQDHRRAGDLPPAGRRLPGLAHSRRGRLLRCRPTISPTCRSSATTS